MDVTLRRLYRNEADHRPQMGYVLSHVDHGLPTPKSVSFLVFPIDRKTNARLRRHLRREEKSQQPVPSYGRLANPGRAQTITIPGGQEHHLKIFMVSILLGTPHPSWKF